MRSSAFIRGEGTRAEVRRSTAAFRLWRSCTSLFHHGDAESRRKSNGRTVRTTQLALLRSTGQPGAAVPTKTFGLHCCYCFLLELLRLIVGRQRVDDRLQLSVHHLLELVDGETDAVVGQPILGEIVGANFF